MFFDTPVYFAFRLAWIFFRAQGVAAVVHQAPSRRRVIGPPPRRVGRAVSSGVEDA
jgi:hypothetical protein